MNLNQFKNKHMTEITFDEFKQYVLGEERIPDRISFYVKHTSEFTKDLFDKLLNWCKNNSEGKPRNALEGKEGCDRYEHFGNSINYTKFNYFLFDNWGLNSNVYNKSTIKERMTYGLDNNRQGCKKEVSIEYIKNLINYKEMERPQTFKITGSKPLLKAMWEELIEMGYTGGNYTTTNNYKELDHISSNYEVFNDERTIEQFKELYAGRMSAKPDVRFNLPEQYNKALKFAKDQLNHPYWNKEKYYNFGTGTTINTSVSDNPLFIGLGLAKENDEHKILLVSDAYELEVIKDYDNLGRTGLKFKKII